MATKNTLTVKLAKLNLRRNETDVNEKWELYAHSPGDGKSRYRIQTKAGHIVTDSYSAGEMDALLSGMILASFNSFRDES